MMSTIFCDNDGCMFSDGCGFCDCDKLSIVGGVCEGSMHGGRNASDDDIDERLHAENTKLRELVRGLYWCNGKEWNKGACDDCPIRDRAVGRCERAMRELGVEVSDD